MNTPYKQEDFIPFIALIKDLSKKYKGIDSSSITYDTAESLMEAIQYTIALNYDQLSTNANLYTQTPDYNKLYISGQKKLEALITDTLSDYHKFMRDFEDYGISNYRNTVVNGLESFFKHYDFRFRPQDHLLTLDYPLLNDDYTLSGILRIKHYIQGLAFEGSILALYSRQDILQRIAGSTPIGQPYFMDNLTYPILLSILCSMLIQKPIDTLQMTPKDINRLDDYLYNFDAQTLTCKIDALIPELLIALKQPHAYAYFKPLAKDYAHRLISAFNNSHLPILFKDSHRRIH